MNKIILNISLFVALLISFNASASMRRCMLLPIKDSVGGAIGFGLFEKVENYLLDSDWCYYRSNSEILNILGNYKRNLDKYLSSPEVIKLIADKTRSGSIIRLEIVSKIKGVKLSIKIFGANGSDLLFQEEADLKTEDASTLSRTVINWLEIYENKIPYHGLISGVLGNRFTTDIGKELGAEAGQNVVIFRPTTKKKHPLFKEIVNLNSINIGKGKIVDITKSLSHGKIHSYDSFKRLKIGDWVILKEKSADISKILKDKYTKKNKNSFGKLGMVGLFLNFGSGHDAATAAGQDTKKIGGTLMGVKFWAELWATRNYWGSIAVAKKFGGYEKEEGVLSSDENSASNGIFKLKAGYRYLPMGFFYGPRVNGYIGYAKYDYGLDNKLADGFTGVAFNGPLLGVKASIPLLKKYRMHMVFDFILKSSFQEDVLLYGESDSTTNYHFELGGSYKYLPNIDFSGSVSYDSNKAKFVAPLRVLALTETIFEFGAVLHF